MPNRQTNHLNRAPGTVVFTGERKIDRVQIHHLRYDKDNIQEAELDNQQPSLDLLGTAGDEVDWYDVRGMHDTELVEFFGDHFTIHPLVLEDVVDTNQRPKYDDFRQSFFLTLRALHFNRTDRKISTEHLAIYCGPGFVITFQEDETDLFLEVRNRLRTPAARIRRRGADYLAYALADNIVDHYYSVMEEVGDLIESIEDKIMENPEEEIKGEIHALRRELQRARKFVIPLREAAARFSRSDNLLISERTKVFIMDLLDHTIQVSETLDHHRDSLHSLQDLYNGEVSYRMNQVMQVLTVVSTVFIPLTFLCGVYGMNFINMPELQQPYGYFYLWGLMILIAVGCMVYFRRKRWL